MSERRVIEKNVFIGICLITTVLGALIGGLFTYGVLAPQLFSRQKEQKSQSKLWFRQGDTLICYYRNATYKYFWNETSRTLVLSGGSQYTYSFWEPSFALFILGGADTYGTHPSQITYFNCSIQFGEEK